MNLQGLSLSGWATHELGTLPLSPAMDAPLHLDVLTPTMHLLLEA